MKSVLLVVLGVALTTAITWWFLSSRPIVPVVAPAAPGHTPIPSAPTSPVGTSDEAADDEPMPAAPGTRPEGRKLGLPDVVTG